MQHWKLYIREHPSVGPWYRRVEGQPGWVIKATLIAAGLVIVVPIIVLALAAILTGLVVFTVLGLIGSLVGGVKDVLSGHREDGPSERPPEPAQRRNVRIIDR